MAQRDYEEQPEAADIADAVQDDTGETLVGPPGADALDAGYIPPDRPYGLDDNDVTPAGQLEGESLGERLRREQPEQTFTDPDRSGRISIADQGAALETPDAMDGVDDGIDGGAASAEEAAVHYVDTSIEPVVEERPIDDPDVAASVAQDPLADRAFADAARDGAGQDQAR
ncbi:MAG TPA: DUF5709 domain-containing protein [Pseudonocardiaceae bacterium]|jgi:hypothetical protein|nr:DUF5709 domain-containing protein [Pseudonocardiaceae bacterium]